MKTKNYSVPKFCGVIYKKISVVLSGHGVDAQRFFQFCLASLALAAEQFKPSSLSDTHKQILDNCGSLGFTPIEESETRKNLLTGLSTSSSDGVLWTVEVLVNYFSRYHVLKTTSDETDPDYLQACENLEQMRNHFKLPGRFRYNKFKKRDSQNINSGILVLFPGQETESAVIDSEQESSLN